MTCEQGHLRMFIFQDLSSFLPVMLMEEGFFWIFSGIFLIFGGFFLDFWGIFFFDF